MELRLTPWIWHNFNDFSQRNCCYALDKTWINVYFQQKLTTCIAFILFIREISMCTYCLWTHAVPVILLVKQFHLIVLPFLFLTKFVFLLKSFGKATYLGRINQIYSKYCLINQVWNDTITDWRNYLCRRIEFTFNFFCAVFVCWADFAHWMRNVMQHWHFTIVMNIWTVFFIFGAIQSSLCTYSYSLSFNCLR